MKKILSVLSMLFVLCTGAFAENVINLGISLPFETHSKSNIRFDYMSGDIHISTFNSDTIGFGAGLGYWKMLRGTNLETGVVADANSSEPMYLDLSMGAAIKVMDSDQYSLILTPGLAFQTCPSASSLYMYVGPSCDLLFTYKLMGFIGLSAGVQFDYYMYLFNFENPEYSGQKDVYAIIPRIGITLDL